MSSWLSQSQQQQRQRQQGKSILLIVRGRCAMSHAQRARVESSKKTRQKQEQKQEQKQKTRQLFSCVRPHRLRHRAAIVRALVCVSFIFERVHLAHASPVVQLRPGRVVRCFNLVLLVLLVLQRRMCFSCFLGARARSLNWPPGERARVASFYARAGPR